MMKLQASVTKRHPWQNKLVDASSWMSLPAYGNFKANFAQNQEIVTSISSASAKGALLLRLWDDNFSDDGEVRLPRRAGEGVSAICSEMSAACNLGVQQ